MERYIYDRQAMGDITLQHLTQPSVSLRIVARVTDLLRGVLVNYPDTDQYVAVRLAFIEGDRVTVRIDDGFNTIGYLELL